MNEEVSSMIFTDINGKWQRIYTSEEVIENLQKEKQELQQRIDKVNEILNDDNLCHVEKLQEIHKILGEKE